MGLDARALITFIIIFADAGTLQVEGVTNTFPFLKENANIEEGHFFFGGDSLNFD